MKRTEIKCNARVYLGRLTGLHIQKINHKANTMKKLTLEITGRNQIRLNNPQTVDPLNKYAIQLKTFTNVHHSRRDEEHHMKMRDVEIKSKLYWDDTLGVYVPSSWMMEAIAKESFAQVKVSKAKMRSAIFMDSTKIKLYYVGEESVKTFEDVALNTRFRTIENIKQGQVRIIKAIPQFNNWSMKVSFDFDDSVYTEQEIKRILQVAVRRNGFGDFRPTFGCGTITEWTVEDEEEVA